MNFFKKTPSEDTRKRPKASNVIAGCILVVFLLIAIPTLISVNTNRYVPPTTPIDYSVKDGDTQVQPMKILVKSQIVKNIDGKFRYFFDIRNNDTKDFEGDISIELFNAEGIFVKSETFSTKTIISPKLGNSVYFDAVTGPTTDYGLNRIKSFKFKISSKGHVVAEGEDQINENRI